MASRPLASSGLAPSIQAQIGSALADPEIQSAKGIRAGIVKPSKSMGSETKNIPKEPVQRVREDVESAPAKRGSKKIQVAKAEPAALPKPRPSRESIRIEEERAARIDAFGEAAEEIAKRQELEDEDRDYPESKKIDAGDEEEQAEESADDAAPEAEETTEEASSVDEASDEAEPEAEDEHLSLDKARKLLRLDGWKTSALDKLSDEEAIELASHRLKVRRGVDAMAAELAGLKKTGTTAKPIEQNPTSPEGQQVTPATSSPTGFDSKKAATKFLELYSQGDADALADGLDHTARWSQGYADKAVKTAVDALKAEFQPYLQALGSLQLNAARTRLAGVYPELADENRFAKVLEKARKFDKTAYENVDDLLSDAAAAVLGPKARKMAQQAAARSARSRGQMSTSTRQMRSSPMTADDRFVAVAEAALHGDLDEAAERARM
jgi:hypothetical protein